MKKQLKSIPFTKMAGTGNDFIVFDNRSSRFSGRETSLFETLCRRRTGVGADGLILVEEGKKAHVRMRYFNRDGRESTMCGNGARCTAHYAWSKRIVTAAAFDLEAVDGIHHVLVDGNRVTLWMMPPKHLKTDLDILREADLTEGGYIDTGVPHFVVFSKNVDDLDVERLGRYYRNHDAFPEGTNVNFVQRLEKKQIRVRTFERGVEAETLSCGTGCVASAFITAEKNGWPSPVRIFTRGGELVVFFDEARRNVSLTAPVTIVYEGVLSMNVIESSKNGEHTTSVCP
jgi:diaminopimelate epimerase